MYVIDSDRHIQEPDARLAPLVRAAVAPRKKAPNTGRYHPLWGSLTYADVRSPSGADDYLADMDTEGVDVAIIYPTSLGLIARVPDADAATALAREYNDWIAAYCHTDPRRLKAVAVVAPQDVAGATAEAQRAVGELGCVGVMLPTWVPGAYLGDRAFDPFYRAVAALDVPIGLHTRYAAEAMPPRFPDILSAHATVHPFEQMSAVCSLVVGGVLERHPTLDVAFLESGIGWVPYWLERLDEEYERLSGEVPWLTQPPSAYLLGGHCWFHAEPDERGLAHAIRVLGDDCIMYASDYPHPDSRFPESARLLAARHDLSASSKQKILADNAARFYRLPAAGMAGAAEATAAAASGR